MKKRTLKEIIEGILPSTPAIVYKFGGEFFGTLYEMRNPLRSLLEFFAEAGLPTGVVYSAPKGLTRELETLLGFARGRKEQLGQAKFRLKKILGEFNTVFRNVIIELEDQFPELETKFAREVRVIRNEQAKAFEKLQDKALRALEAHHEKGGDDCSVATILSLGERAFGSLVLSPAFKMLGLVADKKLPAFVTLNPTKLIVAENSSRIFYTNVRPALVRSVVNLRMETSAIMNRAQTKVSFLMPGFFLGVGEENEIGTMVFNGSDISAMLLYLSMFSDVGLDKHEIEIMRILEQGLGVKNQGELLYVKRVEGKIPSMQELMRIQDKRSDNETKPKELIAKFALFHLFNRNISPKVFDLETRKVITLSTQVTV